MFILFYTLNNLLHYIVEQNIVANYSQGVIPGGQLSYRTECWQTFTSMIQQINNKHNGVTFMESHSWSHIHGVTFMESHSWSHIHGVTFMESHSWSHIHGVTFMESHSWGHIHGVTSMESHP